MRRICSLLLAITISTRLVSLPNTYVKFFCVFSTISFNENQFVYSILFCDFFRLLYNYLSVAVYLSDCLESLVSAVTDERPMMCLTVLIHLFMVV